MSAVFRISYAVVFFVLLIFAWIGWSMYGYIFDTSCPVLVINGIDDGGYYAGDIQATLQGKDDYKVSDLSVWLDGKLIINKFKVNRKEFEHQLPVPTKSLANGKHALKVELIDGAYSKNRLECELTFFVDNTPLQAAFIKSDAEYKVFQGRTLHLQIQVSKEIKTARVNILAREYDFFPESTSSKIYEVFIPISCEEGTTEYPFTIDIMDKTGATMALHGKFQVIPYPFKKQVLTFNTEHIKKQEEDAIDDSVLQQELCELVKKSPAQKLFNGEFYIPMEMTRVSCDYGMKRVTQEKGCYMHKAIDLAGIPRTVIWAPQDGIVIIKNKYKSSGNTVVIDHGLGIFTLLFHLDSFANINVGDKIRRGSPVGKMGMTGYATGYHLHWEMRINNIHVDPVQWTKLDF